MELLRIQEQSVEGVIGDSLVGREIIKVVPEMSGNEGKVLKVVWATLLVASVKNMQEYLGEDLKKNRL